GAERELVEEGGDVERDQDPCHHRGGAGGILVAYRDHVGGSGSARGRRPGARSCQRRGSDGFDPFGTGPLCSEPPQRLCIESFPRSSTVVLHADRTQPDGGFAMGNTVAVTDSSFEQEVLQSSVPVLVDFWAEWCGPCRVIAPVIDQLSVEYAGKLKVVKVDVDQNMEISSRYGIM